MPREQGSRFVLAIARWALVFGVVGSGVIVTGLFDAVGNRGQRSVLMLGTILVSLAFILAPLVRRAFGMRVLRREPPRSYRTMLDEIREGTPAEGVESSSDLAEQAPPDASGLSVIARVSVVLYIGFAVVLLLALWRLRAL